MKEIKPKSQDQIKINAQRQIEKRKKFLGSAKVQPGHRCFEVNISTGVIKEAEFEVKAVYTKLGHSLKKEIMTNPGCVYVIALNKENAKKKLLKNIKS